VVVDRLERVEEANASSSVSVIRRWSASTSAARFAAARRKKPLSDSPTAAAAAWALCRHTNRTVLIEVLGPTRT
jgi:hypothetical protein